MKWDIFTFYKQENAPDIERVMVIGRERELERRKTFPMLENKAWFPPGQSF